MGTVKKKPNRLRRSEHWSKLIGEIGITLNDHY
jgi:hypothetical protein